LKLCKYTNCNFTQFYEPLANTRTQRIFGLSDEISRLDSRLKLINLEVIAQGTATETTLYPRTLIKRILHHNATSIILAHNHPSGVCQPSQQDIALTHQLHSMLRNIDVDLLDHIVVTADQCYSIMLKTTISQPQ
jgi:DNA repair protein RadC